MIRYHSPSQRRSRLAEQENRRLIKQTLLITVASLGIIAAIIFLGIPALIRLAIFLGNLRSSSTPIEQQDTIPPATPQIATLPGATNSAALTLSGYTEAGAAVMLFANGNQLEESVVDSEGQFQFPNISLSDGLNRFYVTARDKAGNESQPSSTQTVVFKNEAPSLTVNNPTDGKQFFGPSQQTIIIEGSTDPDATVSVNDRMIVVSGDGLFTTRYQLQDGDNKLVFTATDTAGNQTQSELTVKYSN